MCHKSCSQIPNPLHTKSGGRLVLTVPLIIFMDDILVNILKQWNKHHVIYMSNTFMPCKMLEMEFYSKYQEKIMLIPYNLFHAGDNPMQAEERSHGGHKCNFFCHTYKIGKMMVAKKMDDGYTLIFKCGELQMLSGGTEKVKNKVSMTGMHNAASTTIIQHLLELGKCLLAEGDVHATLEKDLEELLKDKTIDNYINPLLGIPGLDIHKDTPTEILHTILFRIIKYYWGQMTFILDKSHSLRTFQDGLGDITLVMPYLIYDLISCMVLDGWTIIGWLVVLLWHTEIEDTETYLVHTNNIMPTWTLLT
ncbi:hypothetical protein HD554DRAFT_2207048 [Boletus coccyginus]|nr:hypothetical protein HD554DRAFT_2207048 [Boletus coccyginus]